MRRSAPEPLKTRITESVTRRLTRIGLEIPCGLSSEKMTLFGKFGGGTFHSTHNHLLQPTVRPGVRRLNSPVIRTGRSLRGKGSEGGRTPGRHLRILPKPARRRHNKLMQTVVPASEGSSPDRRAATRGARQAPCGSACPDNPPLNRTRREGAFLSADGQQALRAHPRMAAQLCSPAGRGHGFPRRARRAVQRAG